jgi:hypothetical protein
MAAYLIPDLVFIILFVLVDDGLLQQEQPN